MEHVNLCLKGVRDSAWHRVRAPGVGVATMSACPLACAGESWPLTDGMFCTTVLVSPVRDACAAFAVT